MRTTYRLFSWETKRKMLICSGRNGQQRVLCVSVLGGGMYVHSLNFKATFRVLRRRPRHCQYFAIVFAVVLVAVTVSTYLHVDCHHFICFMSLFQDHVVWQTFILTGPSTKVSYSGYQDFKLPCTTYIQLLDSGGSRGGACSPPLFIFRPRLKKNFFGDWAPQLSQDLDGWAPTYLKVWIRHCLRGGGVGGEKEQLGSSCGL